MPALHLPPPSAARPATRLRQLLVLLLLALALLAGVSVSQTHALHDEALQAEAVRLPVLVAVNDMARQIDEQRGIAALHLALADAAGHAELEARLQAGRSAVERRLAHVARLLTDEASRAQHRSISQGLAAFWEAQDRLIVVSRRAADDAGAARQARALLTGEAQQAFLRLRADLVAWGTRLEQAALQQAAAAREAAHRALQTVWALAAGAALALAVGWALLRWPQRPSVGVDPQLQALGAAVASARHGAPGRAAGRARVAVRTEHRPDDPLAAQVTDPVATACAPPPR